MGVMPVVAAPLLLVGVAGAAGAVPLELLDERLWVEERLVAVWTDNDLPK
jgi:hypothetical protein